MVNQRIAFFYFLLLFSLFSSYAQQGENKIALKAILEQISKTNKIKFNFIEDEIVIYKILPPDNTLPLKEKIITIEAQTGLKFKKIYKNYYSIFNNQKLDKPLCGYLIDLTTDEPIENASINVIGTNNTSISNVNGYFELPVTSSNDLEFSHISYEKKTIPVQELYTSSCPKLKLTPLIQKLNEVYTHQFLTTGIYNKNDGSIDIKPTRFGILPGLIEPDVLQTMQQIPGIQSIDETVSNINVRGGTHDQNLFLWNGIRMFQTGHFFGLISAFNPSLAQTISITKNGTSAFYDEGVSSLIAISTHSKNIEKSSNSISSNLISSEFFSKVKLSNNANFTIAGRRSLTDLFASPTYKNYRNKVFQNTVVTDLNSNQAIEYKADEKFYFYDFTSQYQQKIGKRNELTADLIVIKNALFINQFSNTSSKNSNLGQQNYGGTINWKLNWNTHNYSQIQVYASSYLLTSKNEALETNQILNQENKVTALGIQVQNSVTLSKSLLLNNGYQFDETGVTNFDAINAPAFSRKILEVLRIHSLISESIYESPSKNTFIKAGIRANYFDKFKSIVIEPRLQFNQSLTNEIRLEILGELKSQTLSQIIDLQQDFLGIEKRRWTLANESTIPIQKSNQVSIGLSFKNNNWLITLDNFYKKVTGITTSSQGFQNQFEFVKSNGNYEVIGSEFLIQKNFGKFYSWMSYCYNENNYQFSALTPPNFMNNFELKHSIAWAGIYEWNSLKLALGCKWHSGKPVTTPKSTALNANNAIEYNSPNNANLTDFFQLNFSASKNWKISNKAMLETNISILNLLNAKNSINRFYRVNTTNNTVESLTNYALNLTPNALIKVTF